MTNTAIRWVHSQSWELPFHGLPQEIPWPEGVDVALANQNPLPVDHVLDAIESMGADAPEPWRSFLESATYHEDLAEALEHRETGDALAAINEIDRLLPGSAFVTFHRAHLERMAGDEEEALRLYREAAEQAPTVPPIWSNIGAIHMLRGERDEALASFRKALELAPGDQIALEGLTALKELVKLRSGDASTPNKFHYVDLATFRTLAQKRISEMSDPQELIKYGNKLSEDGSAPEEGVLAIERAMQLAPNDPQTLLTLSVAYRSAGQLEKSKNALQHFTVALPQESVGFYQLAQTLHGLGDFDGEEAALDKVLALDPNSHPGLVAKFRVIPGAHDHIVENTLSDFGKARNSWMAHLFASAIARERGDARSVYRHTGNAFSIAPENEDVLINHASAIGDVKEIAQLAKLIKPPAESGQYSHRLTWTYANVLRQLNMPLDAARVLREAAKDAPDDFRTMVETTVDSWSGFLTGSGVPLEVHQAGFLSRPILITLPDGDGGVLIHAGVALPAEARFPWKAASDKAEITLQQGETGHGKDPLSLGRFLIRRINSAAGVKQTIDCHLQANPDGTMGFRAMQGGHKLHVAWMPSGEKR